MLCLGTATAYVCFIMPGAVGWRLRDRVPMCRTRYGRWVCIGLMAAGTFVGALSTITTIIGMSSGGSPSCDPCADSSSSESC